MAHSHYLYRSEQRIGETMSGIINSVGSKSGIVGGIHGTIGQIINHVDTSTNCDFTDPAEDGVILTTTAGSGWRKTSKALIMWSGNCYTEGGNDLRQHIYITGSGCGSTTSGVKSFRDATYYTPGYMYVPYSGQTLSTTTVGTTTPSFGLYCEPIGGDTRYQWNHLTVVAIEIFQHDNNIQRSTSV